MLSKLRMNGSRGGRVGCAVVVMLACLVAPALAAPASAVLLDFTDDAQIGQIRLSERTKIEPSGESWQGKRAAKFVYAAVPEGVRDYPAAVIEGPALKVRDFSAFESISLWVKNPGPDDADLSLAVWDKDGHRSFPIPSTFTVKPGRWEQVMVRMVLDGFGHEADLQSSVHFYQNVNRKPVTLLLADVELLSPSAADCWRSSNSNARAKSLNTARANAIALGAKDQIEPKIAALAKALDPRWTIRLPPGVPVRDLHVGSPAGDSPDRGGGAGPCQIHPECGNGGKRKSS